MDTETDSGIETAIDALVGESMLCEDSADALRLTQAALNLAHVWQIIAPLRNDNPPRT